MWRTIGIVAASLVVFIHCGGDVGLSASPADGSQEATGGSNPFPAFKNADVINLGGAPTNIAINSGYAGNGTLIDIPSGFLIDDCRFTVAIAQVDGSALSTHVSVDTGTTVEGEAIVICEKVVQARPEVPAETKDCVAAYTVTCTTKAGANSVILKSDGGTCFSVTVSDAGVLGTSATTCP